MVVFGADVGVEQPLAARTALAAPGERAAAINAKGTNIYQAMQLALAMLPAGQANRIVLASDGRQNAGSAFAGAQALKDARIHLPAFDNQARAHDVFVEESQAVMLGMKPADRAMADAERRVKAML